MYYTFNFACNTLDTGKEFPQIQKMKIGYDFNTHDSVHALAKARNKFPTFLPNLNAFLLHSNAKLTDLISSSFTTGTSGILISEKLKHIIEQHKIVSHNFYPATVIFKKEEFRNYYWMHIVSDITSNVDYNKSTFYIYKDYSLNLGNTPIFSKEDLIQKREQLKQDNPSQTITIWADKICFNKTFDKSLDFFKIGMFDSDYYISERLSQILFDNKITGCDINIAQNLLI